MHTFCLRNQAGITSGSGWLFVRTVENDLENSDSSLKLEKSASDGTGEGECKETVVEAIARETQSFDILFVKK